MLNKRTDLLLLLVVSIFISGCSQPDFSESEWRQQVESVKNEELYKAHEKDGIFFNPWISLEKRLTKVLAWKFSGKQAYSEAEQDYLPVLYENSEQQILRLGDGDFILWIGHGSFLIKTGDEIWLLDPMFSKRALLPARKTSPALTAQQINKLFPRLNVVISHNHYDHLDEESIRQLSGKSTFYVPLGLKKLIREWQPEAKVVEMDWWQTKEIKPGYEIHCLPAQHWSRRIFGGVNSSLWASYMLISPDTNIYFGGDSGYFIGYREFGKKYPKIDYALLPTTAYHPRWFMHKAHMNIEEAIQAFDDLGADNFIPTQWGTFHLGDNPPGYPILDLQRVIEEKQLNREQYQILGIGQVLPLR